MLVRLLRSRGLCGAPRVWASNMVRKKVETPTAPSDATTGQNAAPTPSRRARRSSGGRDASPASVVVQPPNADEETPPPKKTPRKRKTPVTAAAAEPLIPNVPHEGLPDEVRDSSKDDAPAKKKRKPKPPPGPFYDKSMRPPPLEAPGIRLLSWNIAGLRSVLSKDASALSRLVESEQPDVICLQETKLQGKHIEDVAAAAGLEGWHKYWNCSTAKLGYSGTATLCRTEPLSVSYGLGAPEHDDEGRVVTVELPDLYLINVYVPNSGEGLRRLEYRVGSWDLALSAFAKSLEARKPVVITGDMNCAHQEIDIHSPKTNLRSAGFTQEERDSFSKCYIDNGFVDTFRHQHPGVVGYTYWTYKFQCRAKNKGWRLDYFLMSESLKDRLHDSYMLKSFLGSDHCPLGLVLKVGNA